MQNSIPSSSVQDHSLQDNAEYIDLRELFVVVWQAKLWIILCVLCTTLAALIYAQLATPYYAASVLLQPVMSDNGKSLSSLSKNLGGLGSLVGLNEGGSKLSANLATLNSRQFLTQFIQQHNLLPVLFPELNDPAKKSAKPPDLYDAYGVFSGVMSVNNDKKTGLVSLNIEWKNAQQAADWANQLVSEVNNYLRDDAVNESKNSILYLQKLAGETQELEVREVIYSLLASEVQSSKVANIRSDYAFKVIDPAVKAKTRSKPKKTFIVVVGFISGFLVSLILVLGKIIFLHRLTKSNQFFA